MSDLVGNPEDRFSRVEAQMLLELLSMSDFDCDSFFQFLNLSFLQFSYL